MADRLLKRSRLLQKVHISWHIAVVSLGVIVGASAAPSTGTMFTSVGWYFVAAILLFAIATKRFGYLLVLAFVAGTIIGLCRGCSDYEALNSYKPYINKQVTIVGRVNEDTSFGPKGDLRLRIADVVIDQNALPGDIWISANSALSIKRGDIVIMSGKLQQGFGNIPASMFRAKVEGVQRPYPGDVGRRARDWFAGGVHRALPAENAEFALAYLVGQKLNMANELNEQLKTIGLVHAVVASGAHLTILISAVRRLFVKVSKYLTALFSVGMISGFILITGFSPSMTRAGLVSLLALTAWYYGRVVHPLVLLPLAAALTVLYKPAYVWGDVGWYLSFAAFAGVLVVAPLIHHYFWGKTKQPGLLRQVLVATIAAQLLTLPITIFVFGYYSSYALIANILVVPLVPLTMLITFIIGVIGLLLPQIAGIVGWPLNAILEYMKFVVDWLANLPGSRSEITFELPVVVMSYIVITVFVTVLVRKTGHKFKQDTKVQQDF